MSHSLSCLSFHPAAPGLTAALETVALQGPFPGWGSGSNGGWGGHLLRVRTRVGVSGRPGPRYLHVPGEVEDVVPLLWGVSLPGRQQEQFVAALRVGARHRGALQTVVVLRRAPRAAARVHGSGLRAGRGVSGSEQRPQEQQHQRRGPQPPRPLHGLEPLGPRTGRRGRGLSSPTAPLAVTSARRVRQEGWGSGGHGRRKDVCGWWTQPWPGSSNGSPRARGGERAAVWAHAQ